MKTILVPTDFSRSADTALHLAISLAGTHRARLILLHVIAIPVAAAPLPYMAPINDLELLRARALESLKTLSSRIVYAGGIDHDYFTTEGAPHDEILRVARETNADLVVMGTSQKSGLEQFIFGTTALGVIRNAACPVLVVPEDMRIAKRIRKITYATDYLESDLKDFRKVAELARPLDAELCLMHISEDEHQPEREVAEFHRFLEEAGRRIDYRKLSAELLTGPDVALRLREYLEAEKTDLLVMSTRRRRLLSRIFEPGLTKKMIRLEQVPVVVFQHAVANEFAGR